MQYWLNIWKWTQTTVCPKITQNIVITRIPWRHDRFSVVCGENSLLTFFLIENTSTKAEVSGITGITDVIIF
jgi:hypothetical protein